MSQGRELLDLIAEYVKASQFEQEMKDFGTPDPRDRIAERFETVLREHLAGG